QRVVHVEIFDRSVVAELIDDRAPPMMAARERSFRSIRAEAHAFDGVKARVAGHAESFAAGVARDWLVRRVVAESLADDAVRPNDPFVMTLAVALDARALGDALVAVRVHDDDHRGRSERVVVVGAQASIGAFRDLPPAMGLAVQPHTNDLDDFA